MVSNAQWIRSTNNYRTDLSPKPSWWAFPPLGLPWRRLHNRHRTQMSKVIIVFFLLDQVCLQNLLCPLHGDWVYNACRAKPFSKFSWKRVWFVGLKLFREWIGMLHLGPFHDELDSKLLLEHNRQSWFKIDMILPWKSIRQYISLFSNQTFHISYYL